MGALWVAKGQAFSRRKTTAKIQISPPLHSQTVQGRTDLNFRCANLCHMPICTLPMVDTGLHDFP